MIFFRGDRGVVIGTVIGTYLSPTTFSIGRVSVRNLSTVGALHGNPPQFLFCDYHIVAKGVKNPNSVHIMFKYMAGLFTSLLVWNSSKKSARAPVYTLLHRWHQQYAPEVILYRTA